MMRKVFSDSEYLEYVTLLDAEIDRELQAHDFAGSTDGKAQSFIHGGENVHKFIKVIENNGMVWYPTLDQLYELMDERYRDRWSIHNKLDLEEKMAYWVRVERPYDSTYETRWFNHPEIAILYTYLFEPGKLRYDTFKFCFKKDGKSPDER